MRVNSCSTVNAPQHLYASGSDGTFTFWSETVALAMSRQPASISSAVSACASRGTSDRASTVKNTRTLGNMGISRRDDHDQFLGSRLQSDLQPSRFHVS